MSQELMDCYASSHKLLHKMMQHSYSSSFLKASLEYMTEGMPIFYNGSFVEISHMVFRSNSFHLNRYMAVGMLIFFTMAFSLKYHIVRL